jgi:hypothetical protein
VVSTEPPVGKPEDADDTGDNQYQQYKAFKGLYLFCFAELP